MEMIEVDESRRSHVERPVTVDLWHNLIFPVKSGPVVHYGSTSPQRGCSREFQPLLRKV
jgi:hypothetical protein